MSKIKFLKLRQPCDLVFLTAVLQCSIIHREAATRHPETCRRGQVHGCRKADMTQVLGFVVSEKKIFACFPHYTPMAGIIKGITYHCYTQNI